MYTGSKETGKRWKKTMNFGMFKAQNIEKSEDVMKRKNKEAESPKHSKKTKLHEGWRVAGRNIVESNAYEISVVVLTFLALFTEDVETLVLTGVLRSTDAYGWLSLREVRPFRRMSILS